MGTNHYVKMECPNACEHCSIEDVHIGKSYRMFQAHMDSPWGVIESWKDWKAVLVDYGLQIVDEYGTLVDTSDFIRDVESTSMEDRRRQYDAVRDSRWSMNDYLCEDGFSFTHREFS